MFQGEERALPALGMKLRKVLMQAGMPVVKGCGHRLPLEMTAVVFVRCSVRVPWAHCGPRARSVPHELRDAELESLFRMVSRPVDVPRGEHRFNLFNRVGAIVRAPLCPWHYPPFLCERCNLGD